MSVRDLVLLLTNRTPNVRYNGRVSKRRQPSRRLPVISDLVMHFTLACFILASTRLHKHVLPNSAVIKTTCLNFGTKQFVQIFLSSFNTTPSLHCLAHIVGHFLLATLSHGTGLTHGVAYTRVLPTGCFCL
jgi:ABC-type polysaccharide/polyol phosphate export permease